MKYLLPLLFLLLPISMFSQLSKVEECISGTTGVGLDVIGTKDNGFLVVGYNTQKAVGKEDILLAKFDSIAELKWAKDIGDTGDEYAQSITKTADGGYLVTGTTMSFGSGGYDMLAIKLDSNANVQWEKAIGGSGNEVSNAAFQAFDKGYFLFGYTTTYCTAGKNAGYIVKLDSTGNLQWTKSITDGSGSLQFISADRTLDKGYILLGNDHSVVKLDSIGNIKWHKVAHKYSAVGFSSIAALKNGSYMITGGAPVSSMEYDVYVMLTDTALHILKQENIGWNSYEYIAKTAISTRDSGFAVTGYGYTATFHGSGPAGDFIFRFDKFGTPLWSANHYGYNYGHNFVGYRITQTRDGGFAGVGSADTGTSTTVVTYPFFEKIDSLGNNCYNSLLYSALSNTAVDSFQNVTNDSIGSGGVIETGNLQVTNVGSEYLMCRVIGMNELSPPISSIKVYPDPANNSISIDLPGSGIFYVTIYNELGQEYRKYTVPANENIATIDISGLSKGLYFIRVASGKDVAIRKFIKQ